MRNFVLNAFDGKSINGNVETKTPTEKSSEKKILLNKSVQKTVVKIHEICWVRKFTAKITATVVIL